MSIDGFIATEDDGLDWLEGYDNPTGSDYGYAEFMERIDAIVMGRRTYEKVLAFPDWPYDRPVYVMSRTLPPGERPHSVSVVAGGPDAVVTAAHQGGHLRLYVDGGRTIQSFLAQDLIDEMIITTVPVVLGGGIPLFRTADTVLQFELLSSTHAGPFAQSHFVRRR
jgi:dihydrofolate reductase